MKKCRVMLIGFYIVAWVAFCMIMVLSTPPKDDFQPPIAETSAVDPEILVVVRYANEQEQKQRDEETINALAQTVWGESRGCSITEQAAVVWCILNRLDSEDFPNDPLMVVQQPGQFDGYHPDYPIEQELVDLVKDVMDRWELEKTAVGSVGRVLPKEYTFFHGDSVHNHFRDAYIGGNTWDWSLDSPYEEGKNETNYMF